MYIHMLNVYIHLEFVIHTHLIFDTGRKPNEVRDWQDLYQLRAEILAFRNERTFFDPFVSNVV